jgi:sphinganine-1-phosphate aldolase
VRDEELDWITQVLEDQLRPYRKTHAVYRELPEQGRARNDVLAEMRELAAREAPRWRDGFASGAVYHGADDHIAFANEAYSIASQSNPLHPDLWPSAIKYEAEIVAMTASLLGGGSGAGRVPTVCGTVSSGGTESIMLAMRAYRDWARTERGIDEPEIVAPRSAHAAFDKAARFFGMRLVTTELGPDWRADVGAMEAALGPRTAVLVASAPGFPHGVVDPVGEIAALAQRHGVGCHVDACLGGFVLPFAARLGYPVPPFDFRVPGVTSMSVDPHKFGYAPKGTSVVLYRDPSLRRYQYYCSSTWMGGLYYSPTFAGSRPGGLSAACWAVMVSLGMDGYLALTRRLLDAATRIKEGIEDIPALEILGDPLFVIAFRARALDVYALLDKMSSRGWSLNGLQDPPAAHLCVTQRHAEPGVAERFLDDLRASVAELAEAPGTTGTMAPIYGMAASVETRGTVDELLVRYGDLQFKT